MAFGQHLGADQDVGRAALNRLHHRLPLLAAACRIAVHAQDAGLREALGKSHFDPLRPAAEGAEILVATGWAGFRHTCLVSRSGGSAGGWSARCSTRWAAQRWQDELQPQAAQASTGA
jgi:hypothetical protein